MDEHTIKTTNSNDYSGRERRGDMLNPIQASLRDILLNFLSLLLLQAKLMELRVVQKAICRVLLPIMGWATEPPDQAQLHETVLPQG
jgi:hypothetical protein